MTQPGNTITVFPSGDKGVLGSPEHRLLRKLRDFTGPSYLPASRTATVTQLRALERKGFAVLVRHNYTVLGAHLAPRGERHLEQLDAATERRRLYGAP